MSPSTSDPIDTVGLRRLLAEATPRPWRVAKNIDDAMRDWPLMRVRLGVTDEGDEIFVCTDGLHASECNGATGVEDAALIVAAVNALGPLLDEVERLRPLADANRSRAQRCIGAHRIGETCTHPDCMNWECASDQRARLRAALARVTAERDNLRVALDSYDPDNITAARELDRLRSERDHYREANIVLRREGLLAKAAGVIDGLSEGILAERERIAAWHDAEAAHSRSLSRSVCCDTAIALVHEESAAAIRAGQAKGET